MSWTDRIAIKTIKQLRDDFNIIYFVETGTFKGCNALVQSRNFKVLMTCELNEEYFNIAKDKLIKYENIFFSKQSSPEFLEGFKYEIMFFIPKTFKAPPPCE